MSHYQLMAGRAVAVARPLPLPLIEARAHVFDRLTCLDLNLNARRVLFGILTFVRIKTPTTEIFPRRDTLRAEALLESNSTLYRGLAMLEQKGYITRSQSRKLRDGRFYLSPIFLTVKALVLLGLADFIHSSPSSKLRGGHKEKELAKKSQSIQKTTSASVSGIHDILTVISELEEASAQISAAISQQNSATMQISESIQSAAGSVSEVDNNIHGVSDAAQEAGVTASRMRTASELLSEQSNILKSEVMSFLNDVRVA